VSAPGTSLAVYWHGGDGERCWRPSIAVLGDGFKFRDYAAAFGEAIVPDVWRLADQSQVAVKQAALLSAVRGLRDVVA
jgi:hypothetical protein